jgi:hypothetical protein
MKSYLTIFGILILLAFVGILSQGGEANIITYLSVAPLVLFGAFYVTKSVLNETKKGS